MNKQELLTQADYTFQRGNRDLAKKYIAEILAAHPDDEAAWMLLARVMEEKERKVECYERVLKINPKNEEARLALTRVRASINPTLPLPKQLKAQQQRSTPHRNVFRGALVAVIAFLLFGTTTFVIARNNPNSKVAQVLAIATPTMYSNAPLTGDVAPKTRAEISEKYPQYVLLVDTLLGFAIDNTQNGMEGAPERPGDSIVVSDQAGLEAKDMVENSIPQPGTLTSITITEQQITSWLALEMKENPDLPLNDIQVYLRNGKVQLWGMVNNSDNATSALVIGEIKIDENKKPYFDIESMQVGQQVIPDLLVSQMEAWINQVMLENIEKQLPGLQLMNVKVTSGMVTVSGMR
ncbi:MAG: hypothetical protein JNK32_05460 [Anaerolineales bacterium]|nr:hypothetical protein [Anaerolineales bacterium]